MKVKALRTLSFLITISAYLAFFLGSELGYLEGSCSVLILLGLLLLSCPLGALQLVILGASTSLLYAALIPLALILLFGRLTCGWFCPLGSVFLRYKKIPRGITRYYSPKLRLFMHSIALLILLLGCVLLGLPLMCLICPVGIILRLIVWIVTMQFSEILTLIWCLSFLAILVTLSRIWCLWICPLGGFLSLISPFKFIRIKVVRRLCNACSFCAQICPLDIRIHDDRHEVLNNSLCILCTHCLSTCNRNSLRISFFFRRCGKRSH